jgi:hypothetical protein
VRLDDGDVLVDPTTRTTAFGELPASDEDRMCHPFTKAGEEPIPTPSTSFEHDVLRRTWSFAMDGRGDVTGSVVAVAAGDFADTVRDLMLATSGVAQRQAPRFSAWRVPCRPPASTSTTRPHPCCRCR